MRKKKASSTKYVDQQVWTDEKCWTVQYGELSRGQGRPDKTAQLFTAIGEKLPLAALDDVRKHCISEEISVYGVYIAHDSMGCPRYVGRGNIFNRLKDHFKAHTHELTYFSFYIVEDKKHEREIETLIIRAASHLLEFNTKKKRTGILPGDVRDYEAGTFFFERQHNPTTTFC